MANGKQVAFVVKKGAREYDKKLSYSNSYLMTREQAIKHFVDVTDEDIIVSDGQSLA